MTKTGRVTAQELAGFTNLCQSHIRMLLEVQASGGWLYYSGPSRSVQPMVYLAFHIRQGFSLRNISSAGTC